MLIYNQTIYGDITTNGVTPYVGDMTILVWNYDFSFSASKTITVSGEYQFNLGDSDLFGASHNYTGFETVIIQTTPLTFSNRVKLPSSSCINYDIDISGHVDVTAEANMDTDRKVITADVLLLTEYEDAMYNYFSVELDGEILHEANGSFTRFYPEQDGEYTITQKGVNVTTGVYSEKVSTVTLFDGLITLDSLDYIFYTKKNIIIQIELPDFVINTLILESNWYFENGKLIGKNTGLSSTVMPYSKGKVIVKTQIGDIVDY
jgi:hypothetical protein